MIIFYLLIIIIIFLFYKNNEYFSVSDSDSIYQIDTIFPKIVNKNNASYDDTLFYCKDEEYIIDPQDIDFRDVSKLYSYRPKRIKSTI
jgi:hypothetical protein